MILKKIFSVRVSNKKFVLSQKCFSTEIVEWKNAKPYEAIPGPKNAFDIIRMMGPGGRYRGLPLDVLFAKFREDFGTIVNFPSFLGQRPMVITFLPEDIETVLRNEGKFPSRRPFESIAYFRKTHRPDLYPAGAGLTVTQDEDWYNFRSKVQQVLMQPQATKVYIPNMDKVAREFIDKIREIRNNNNETPANFFENITEWALESIGLIALDTRLGLFVNPEQLKINQLTKHVFKAICDYDVMPSIWRYYKTPGFKKALKVYEDVGIEIRKYIMAAVEKYEKNPTVDHEAGVLEKLIKVDKNIGIAMAEDMLLAGIDTTSAALTSVMYCLARNPDKQEILRKEILQILPEKDSKLTPTSFSRMPYLRAVIKESLRVRPVVNENLRGAGTDLVLQGYQIPKGMDVMMANGTISRDEKYFKQSGKFIPERWLKDNTDPKCPHATDAHPFTYLPFGFGPRMCIGRRFAELEIEVLISRLIREFKIEWHHADLKFRSITISYPDGPLKFRLVDY